MAMTYHARIERADRLTYIAMNVGFGEVILEGPHPDHPNRIQCLTNTGVFIVKTKQGDVVTAFIPTVERVCAMYKYMGYNRVPTYVMNKAKKNVKHIVIQNTVRY